MNLFKIADTLSKDVVSEETFNKPANRMDMLRKTGDIGKKLLLASLPFALTAVPKYAKAQSGSITDTLNFALTLEYLESEFYKMGLAANNLIPSSDRAVFTQISKHETEHVNYLKAALGVNAVAKPTFDFTAGGTFPDVFTNYVTFLAISQAFEDTGVRAYKGQATNLMSDPATLTAALQIHSVEARHASEVRRIRLQKGWVTGDTGMANGEPAAVDAVYAGENNTMQGGVDVTTITSATSNGVKEAFDEPLDMDAVLKIASLFIK